MRYRSCYSMPALPPSASGFRARELLAMAQALIQARGDLPASVFLPGAAMPSTFAAPLLSVLVFASLSPLVVGGLSYV